METETPSPGVVHAVSERVMCGAVVGKYTPSPGPLSNSCLEAREDSLSRTSRKVWLTMKSSTCDAVTASRSDGSPTLSTFRPCSWSQKLFSRSMWNGVTDGGAEMKMKPVTLKMPGCSRSMVARTPSMIASRRARYRGMASTLYSAIHEPVSSMRSNTSSISRPSGWCASWRKADAWVIPGLTNRHFSSGMSSFARRASSGSWNRGCWWKSWRSRLIRCVEKPCGSRGCTLWRSAADAFSMMFAPLVSGCLYGQEERRTNLRHSPHHARSTRKVLRKTTGCFAGARKRKEALAGLLVAAGKASGRAGEARRCHRLITKGPPHPVESVHQRDRHGEVDNFLFAEFGDDGVVVGVRHTGVCDQRKRLGPGQNGLFALAEDIAGFAPG